MPPSTRREIRLSASLPDPSAYTTPLSSVETSRSASILLPNMESILENFEQFKRKHISQNREVIKANALAQLRIRELESRIQTLECEKVEQALTILPVKARLSRLQRALGRIRHNWDSIGHELDPIRQDLPGEMSGETKDPCGFGSAASGPCFASKKVRMEPNLNAIGVVKSISKAPESNLGMVVEDDEHRGMHWSPQSFQQSNSEKIDDDQECWTNRQMPLGDVRLSTDAPRNYTALMDVVYAPSSMESPGLPMDVGDTYAGVIRSHSETWSHIVNNSPRVLDTFESGIQAADDLRHAQENDQRLQRRPRRKSNRRQSGLILQTTYPDDVCDKEKAQLQSAADNASSLLHVPDHDGYSYTQSTASSRAQSSCASTTSVSQSPTPVHDEKLRDVSNGIVRSLSPGEVVKTNARKARRQTMDMSMRTKEESVKLLTAREPVTPGRRKRKTPAFDSHEQIFVPANLFDRSTSEFIVDAYDAENDSQGGRTRRTRKSVNYALPKLNTKMRKPDPNELVPVLTPQRSTLNTPTASETVGDVSDIRKQHEASDSRTFPAERVFPAREQGSPTCSKDRKKFCAEDENRGPGFADKTSLFEIRRCNLAAEGLIHPNALKAPTRSAHQHLSESTWEMRHDLGSSDDEGAHASSNGDLDEIANMDGALSDDSSSEERDQVLAPRVGPPSSSLSAQMLSSTSSDSLYAPLSDAESGTRKMYLTKIAAPAVPHRRQNLSVQTDRQMPKQDLVSVSQTGYIPSLSNSNSTRLVASQPPQESSTSFTGLAAGMKSRQRPTGVGARAGANVMQDNVDARGVSQKESTIQSTGVSHKSLSGSTTTNAELLSTKKIGDSSSRSDTVSHPVSASASRRVGLHSALTSQTRPTFSTPRGGSKALSATSTPISKTGSRL